MKNVAILTEEFIKWGGGKDFIENIIFSLKSVAVENKLNLYIFIPTDINYKQYHGMKRIFFKGKEKFLIKHRISLFHEKFENLEGIKFVEYPEISLSRALKKFKIDIVFPISTLNRLKIKTPQILYLADCQHKYFPNFFGKNHREYCDKMFDKMIKSQKKIIVNANSVKEDLIKFYDANPENIFVLPFAPNARPEFFEDNSNLIAKYNLPERYFIISNQFWLQKDHETAFRAFARLVEIDKYKDIQLICTGKMQETRHPQHIDDMLQLINNLGMQNKIRCLGFLPKLEQIEIMKGSQAVIQSTIFEGGPGGGSVWDAVSLGVPAIISSIQTNLEIKDDNVTFFKAKDPIDLCEKMQEILSKPKKSIEKEILIKMSDDNRSRLGQLLISLINNCN